MRVPEGVGVGEATGVGVGVAVAVGVGVGVGAPQESADANMRLPLTWRAIAALAEREFGPAWTQPSMQPSS